MLTIVWQIYLDNPVIASLAVYGMFLITSEGPVPRTAGNG